MTKMVGLTESTLSRVMGNVKEDTAETVLKAALTACGRKLTVEIGSQTLGKTYKYGEVVKRTTQLVGTSGVVSSTLYYYYNGSKLVRITASGLRTLLDAGVLFAYPLTIPKDYWGTSTPFKDNCGYLKGVARGETVLGHTRWLLQMEEDSEDQGFTAGNGKVADYYGSHQFTYGRPMGIWELWLPEKLGAGTVVIDY